MNDFNHLNDLQKLIICVIYHEKFVPSNPNLFENWMIYLGCKYSVSYISLKVRELMAMGLLEKKMIGISKLPKEKRFTDCQKEGHRVSKNILTLTKLGRKIAMKTISSMAHPLQYPQTPECPIGIYNHSSSASIDTKIIMREERALLEKQWRFLGGWIAKFGINMLYSQEMKSSNKTKGYLRSRIVGGFEFQKDNSEDITIIPVYNSGSYIRKIDKNQEAAIKVRFLSSHEYIILVDHLDVAEKYFEIMDNRQISTRKNSTLLTHKEFEVQKFFVPLDESGVEEMKWFLLSERDRYREKKHIISSYFSDIDYPFPMPLEEIADKMVYDAFAMDVQEPNLNVYIDFMIDVDRTYRLLSYLQNSSHGEDTVPLFIICTSGFGKFYENLIRSTDYSQEFDILEVNFKNPNDYVGSIIHGMSPQEKEELQQEMDRTKYENMDLDYYMRHPDEIDYTLL